MIDLNVSEIEKLCRYEIDRAHQNGCIVNPHYIHRDPAAVMLELITRLRQAEKDAARYRWLLQNAKLGIGRNGKDWDLLIDGPAPDSISEVGEWIDAHSSDCVYGPLVPVMK